MTAKQLAARPADVGAPEADSSGADREAQTRSPLAGRNAWWIALGVAIMAWDVGTSRPPTSSIDDSWRYLLQRASEDGADFGVDTAFTYGPLVHLDGGPMFSLLGGLCAVVVVLVLGWTSALFAIRSGDRVKLPWRTTVLCSLSLTVVFAPPFRVSEMVAIVAASWLISQIVDGRATAAMQNTVAVLSGIWLLVKPSAALVMAAVVVATSIAGVFDPDQPIRLRRGVLGRAVTRVATVTAICSVTAVSAWILTGQKLSSLGDYLSGAKQIAGGFAEGMVVGSYHPVLEVVFVVVGFVLAGLLGRRAWQMRDARTIFTFLLVLMMLVWVRQIALGRPDSNHMKDGGAALVFLALAVWPLVERHVISALIAVSTFASVWIMFGAPFVQVGATASLGPVEAVRSINALIHSDETLEANRAYLAALLEPEEHLRSQIEGQRVFFSPYRSAAGFTVDSDYWFPPVVQNYASFNASVEGRGVAGLLGPDGPQVILHQTNEAVDERHPAWESPHLIVSMFCSFRPVDGDRQYALLERAPTTCETTTIAEQVPVVDSAVAVPDSIRGCSGLVTFRTFGVETSLLRGLTQLVLRPEVLYVTLGSNDWQVVPGTMSEPHVLAAPDDTAVWMGDAVPDVDSAATKIRFGESFGDAPLTTTFECWTRQPAPPTS